MAHACTIRSFFGFHACPLRGFYRHQRSDGPLGHEKGPFRSLVSLVGRGGGGRTRTFTVFEAAASADCATPRLIAYLPFLPVEMKLDEVLRDELHGVCDKLIARFVLADALQVVGNDVNRLVAQ